MLSIRFRRRRRVRRRCNDFCFSRQNRLCLMLDICDEENIGLENVLDDLSVSLALCRGRGTL